MLKIAKLRKIKDQFVLVVGDEGAILCHYMAGKLANRIYVDSPASDDTKLMSRLLETYSKLPVSMLVDVIEQNYTQQILPPVSRFSVQSQVKRRMKRDMQATDLNNYMFINQQKEGRKDWNFLFISLANAEPFSKWLEFLLRHKNNYKGTFLMPVESMPLSADLIKYTPDHTITEWEILVLHNKTGGFRIMAFKGGKLVFTRLAQNLIGDNIPEVIVGNLEHEIGNTVEYLKRLGFRSETDSSITIISSAEVLQKIDVRAIKFGSVNLFSPHQAAQRIGLAEYINDRDKFADILMASHFASSAKHVLKFDTEYSKRMDGLFNIVKVAYIASFLILGAGIAYQATKFNHVYDLYHKVADKQNELKRERVLLTELEKKTKDLPADIKRLVDIYTLQSELPQDKQQLLTILSKLVGAFNDGVVVSAIYYKIPTADPKQAADSAAAALKSMSFELVLNVEFRMSESQREFLNTNAQQLLDNLKKQLQGYDVVYSKPPSFDASPSIPQLDAIDAKMSTKGVYADIRITPAGGGGI